MRREPLIAAGVVVLGLGLGLATHARHAHPLLALGLMAIVTIALFVVCGDALVQAFVPRDWGSLRALLAFPVGAASSGVALTVFGLAHVPLAVSVWLVLGLGVAASLIVRRRRRGPRPERAPIDRVHLASWVVVLGVVFFVALIPAWRAGEDTIFGLNPDAHQVAGIAVLFQHVPPTGTDLALPIDTVPSVWRFRYPIFYGLAAVSHLTGQDPIRVFPAIAALLLVAAALGFALIAVRCLDVPVAAGLGVALSVGVSAVPLYLAWHPYWNQLWALALLPYAVLFGWVALRRGDGRIAGLLVVMLVTLWLAYPLALPYPLLLLAVLAGAYRRRPRLAALARARSWVWVAVVVVLLAPAVAGAALKLWQGISQLLSPHSSLWGGDIKDALPLGRFVGTGGGWLPALAVLALAIGGLLTLPRRVGWWLGGGLAVLCLLDLRFRLASGGAYMDFKHLTFVGAIVLLLAAVAVVRLLRSRARIAVAAGAAVTVAWLAAALVQVHREALAAVPQVTPEMFQIRTWASRLPPGASVRVDIPPSGVQLWAVYMLGDHPVDSPAPVLFTTYAHASFGLRADYSLSLRWVPSPIPNSPPRPFPRPPFVRRRPLFQNAVFVLRAIAWPRRLDAYPRTASTRLVEP